MFFQKWKKTSMYNVHLCEETLLLLP